MNTVQDEGMLFAVGGWGLVIRDLGSGSLAGGEKHHVDKIDDAD